ncbi:tetratricopeptide repeat protein [Actomonas aquatica]|uniref:DUF7477 domain-containing protein n=1 Tax=Actomonas aquatica TaxID=2866162 RepID=A0ABZ1C2W8_9BACT|nr:tetratricopeptide repeat protein [Opitutus sp. WL0086]WRQ85593.1 hypothetical protein K1X11_012345 [Opitutus sp. WL0086]
MNETTIMMNGTMKRGRVSAGTKAMGWLAGVLVLTFGFGRALAVEPAAEEAFAAAVVAYLESGDAAAAQAAFVELQAQWPDYPDPVFNLAVLAEARGDAEEAMRGYERFLAMAPGHAKAAEARGALLALQQRPSAAEAYGELLARADARWRAGDLAGAFAEAAAAQALQPERWEAPALAAQVLAADGAWDDALPLTEQAVARAPEGELRAELAVYRDEIAARREAATARAQAEQLESAGDFAAAAAAYATVAESTEDGAVALLAGLNFGMVERWDDAAGWLARAVEWGDVRVVAEAQTQLSAIEQRRRVERRVATVEGAAEGTSDGRVDAGLPGRVDYEKGVVLLGDGATAEALAAFDAAIAQVPVNPDYARYFLMRGAARLDAGDAEAALEDLARAGLIDPAAPSLYELRALANVELGRYAEAIADYREARKRVEFASQEKAIEQQIVTLLLKEGSAREAMVESQRLADGTSGKPHQRALRSWAQAARQLDMDDEELKALGRLQNVASLSSSEGQRLRELRRRWVVVMTESNTHQTYGWADDELRADLSGYWREGQNITNLTRDDERDRWLVVRTKSPLHDEQNVETGEAFPRDWIKAKWDQGYGLMEFEVTAEGRWAVLMARGASLGKQWWKSVRDDGLSEGIQDIWSRDMRIQDVAYHNGLWYLAAAAKAPYGVQRWTTSVRFPERWIAQGYDQGYIISRVAHGAGKWFVVMAKSDLEQRYFYRHELPDEAIKAGWDDGLRLTEVVKVIEPLP